MHADIRDVIKRLSNFLLGKPLPGGILDRIIEETSFENMKANSDRKAKLMLEMEKDKMAVVFGKDEPSEGAPPIFIKAVKSQDKATGKCCTKDVY